MLATLHWCAGSQSLQNREDIPTRELGINKLTGHVAIPSKQGRYSYVNVVVNGKTLDKVAIPSKQGRYSYQQASEKEEKKSVAIPSKQGRYSYSERKKGFIQCNFVAIPSKQGRYSYRTS